MAGSLRVFKYKCDDGKTEFNINVDESLTEQINGSLTAEELKAMDSISAYELTTLDNILDKEVPSLRRSASPVFDRSTHK